MQKSQNQIQTNYRTDTVLMHVNVNYKANLIFDLHLFFIVGKSVCTRCPMCNRCTPVLRPVSVLTVLSGILLAHMG